MLAEQTEGIVPREPGAGHRRAADAAKEAGELARGFQRGWRRRNRRGRFLWSFHPSYAHQRLIWAQADLGADSGRPTQEHPQDPLLQHHERKKL